MIEIIKVWGIDVEVRQEEVFARGLEAVANDISRDYQAISPFFPIEELKEYLKSNIVIGYWEDIRLLTEKKKEAA